MKVIVDAARALAAGAAGLALLGAVAAASGAQADEWPTEPLTFVVPFDAGGSADRMARGVAEHMAPRLGVPIQVVNRPGGAGALGVTYFQQQPADGSHVLFMQATPYLASAILVSGAPVAWEDFEFLNAQWNDYGIVVVHEDSPYQTFEELAEAMLEPGAVSSGIIVGAGGHIQTLVILEELGIDPDNIRFVTYSGGAPLRTALAGNQVDFQILAAEAAESIRDRVRVLAVVYDEDRGGYGAPLLNDVMAELGHDPVPLIGGNITGPIVHASLREEHPERYETLLEAYREAIESEEFQDWAEGAGIGADWVGPEESQAMADEAYEALEPIADRIN
jgi:putative tricarboxylic transport membrane protein